MRWHSFTGGDVEWEQTIAQFHNQSPYQTSAWARFRESEGWTSIRLITPNHAASVQFLYRSTLGLGVAWAPGGPLGDTSTAVLNSLFMFLCERTSDILTYVRISDFAVATRTGQDQYLRGGWQRPQRLLNSGRTLTRSLVSDTNTLQSTYTKNWARNLRRGEDRGISASVWNSPDPTEIARLHAYVAKTKGISANDWRTKSLRVAHLLECFQNRLIVVKAVDSGGTTHAIRGAVLCGSTGFDFLAATSSEGRKTYASNVALHHLLEVLAQQGMVTYDFGGVDPTNNKGVYDFKHGAGGHEQFYLGEFERASPRLIRRPLSTLISLRTAT